MAYNRYEDIFVSLPCDLFPLNPVYLHAGSPSGREGHTHCPPWLSSHHLSSGGIIPWSEASPLPEDAPLLAALPPAPFRPLRVPWYRVLVSLLPHLLTVAPHQNISYLKAGARPETAPGTELSSCLLNLSFRTSVIWALSSRDLPCLCHICTKT